MKKGDARREELLAAAEKLFYTKGYEKTSVQDILDAINFSKGGFYHHFDSKLAVLETICQQRAEETCELARQHAMSDRLNAVEKLNALLAGSTLWQSDNPGFVAILIQVAYREDSALMRAKMQTCQLKSMQETMEAVLRQGVKSREFFVDDVPSCAALVLRLYMQFSDEIAFLLAKKDEEEELFQEMVTKVRAYRTAIERILSAPFGSVVLVDIDELQTIGKRILRDRNRQRAEAMLK